MSRGDYKEVLATLGWAMFKFFEVNGALQGLRVGIPNAEYALRLSAFGVHANEFLLLQNFLPWISKQGTTWNQSKYGHPANWRPDVAEFCLKTFVDVILCVQDAESPAVDIEFDLVYQHKVTALFDRVPIRQQRSLSTKEIVRILNKGESIIGKVTNESGYLVHPSSGPVLGMGSDRKLKFFNDEVWGEIEKDKVNVVCVPKQTDFVKKYFPKLPEIPWEG